MNAGWFAVAVIVMGGTIAAAVIWPWHGRRGVSPVSARAMRRLLDRPPGQPNDGDGTA